MRIWSFETGLTLADLNRTIGRAIKRQWNKKERITERQKCQSNHWIDANTKGDHSEI